MKIGILLTEYTKLANWQLRIIQALVDDLSYEVILLVGKKEASENSIASNSSKFNFSRWLLAFQTAIEQKIFFKEIFSVTKESLYQSLKKLPQFQFNITDKGVSISEELFDKIKQENIDLILDLEFQNNLVEILNSSKFGVWNLLHYGFSEKKLFFTGFSEVVQKKPSIECTLVKRTSDTAVEVIDQSFFNRGWSMVETATTAQEGSVSVLLKNLEKLKSGYSFEFTAKNLPQYGYPELSAVIKYYGQFYGQLVAKLMQKLAYTFLGKRHECWSVFLGKGNYIESSLSDFKPLNMPKDEFWADPFLFKYHGVDYLFFENYSYINNRGKISCGVIKEGKLIDVVDVLDLNYHLSFPFIFEEDGAVYLMPETSENKRLEIYKAVNFPTEWQLFTTAFEGEMVADAFFYNDSQKQKWLFLNKQAAETSPLNSELFIYKADSISLKNLQPHAQNPVIIDARVARNGGAIFEHKNILYRPSQRNIDGIYGRALNLNKIKKLTLKEYEEETVQIIEPDFDKNLMATHHLHQTDNLFVFDAAYKTK